MTKANARKRSAGNLTGARPSISAASLASLKRRDPVGYALVGQLVRALSRKREKESAGRS